MCILLVFNCWHVQICFEFCARQTRLWARYGQEALGSQPLGHILLTCYWSYSGLPLYYWCVTEGDTPGVCDCEGGFPLHLLAEGGAVPLGVLGSRPEA